MLTKPRQTRPTLAMVAKEAGVSIGTASNILTGKTELHTPETVEMVLQVARRLGYRPNRIARSLVARQTHTIGVIMEPAHTVFTRNIYATGVLDGLVDLLSKERYHLKVISLTVMDTRTLWAQVDDGSIDGAVLLVPLIGSPLLEWYQHTPLPCVVVGSVFDESMGFYYVDSDSVGGIRQVVEWLLEQGHRRLGFLRGPSNQTSALRREQAFRETLMAHGVPIVDSWIAGESYLREGGYEAMKSLLSLTDRPTAVVCANDLVAIGALEACRELGVAVPDEISITGFDDIPVAGLTDPPLSTVRNPIHEIGYHAGEALLEQIRTGTRKRGVRLFSGELVVRGSVRVLVE